VGLKPELEELLLQSGVKGMKWDEAKKKHNQELAAQNKKAQEAWKNGINQANKIADFNNNHDTMPKDQILKKDKNGAIIDQVKTIVSDAAAKKVKSTLSSFSHMTLSELFNSKNAKPKITSSSGYTPMVQNHTVKMDKHGNITSVTSSKPKKGLETKMKFIKSN
jgi:hypothetical protein